ncbi:MAG: ABC transporter permease subunit [Planctomycetota bacterium]
MSTTLIKATRAGFWAEWARLRAPAGLRKWTLQIGIAAILTHLALEDSGHKDASGWFYGFFLMLFFSATCLQRGASLVRDEAEAGTLGYSLCRPLRRSKWLASRLLALWAILLVQGVGTAMVSLAVAKYNGVRDIGTLCGGLLLAMPAAAAAWISLGSLFGLLVRRHQILSMLWVFMVELGIGKMEITLGHLSITRHIAGILPQKSILESLYPGAGEQGPMIALMWILGMSLTFTLLTGSLFSRKDWASGDSPL